ncbi:MAG: heptosyltransferase-3 [Candidatus Binatia bacterium]|jgi:heptosyltransferase-3
MTPEPNHPTPVEVSRLRLLLVKLKHIGDALLLTPTVLAIRQKYPNAEIWVVVRAGTEGILAGCSAIDRILTVTPTKSDRRPFGSLWRDLRTWFVLRGRKFDYAFELTDGDRGRWLAGMSRARARCVNVSFYRLSFWWKRWFNRLSSSPWTTGHRVKKDFDAVADFLPLSAEIPPLCFERSAAREPDLVRKLDNYAIVHPGTRWPRKQWPIAYWGQVGEALLERVEKIVISCGPDPEERALAAKLIETWGADRAVSVDGGLGWPDLAGMLFRARLFVGVDTAAMHLAAACQCPVIAIFGDSVASQWRPWKAPHALIQPADLLSREKIEQIPSQEIIRRVTPDLVLKAIDSLIRPSIASAS